MGQIDNNNFIIKEDGTIIREPNLEELKKRIEEKKTDEEDKQKNKTSNDNNGCVSLLIQFVVFILITTIIGGVIGFFIDKHDSVELGLLLGGLFGIGFCLCTLVEELFN